MKSERGQSFIELGLSMIFLLILLAGVMDLGRLIFTYIALRDAVQEGAAYTAMNPKDCTGAITRIRQHTSGAVDLSAANIDVSIEIDNIVCSAAVLDNICPGDSVGVVATYNNFAIAAPFIGTILGGQEFDFDTRVTDSILVDPTPSTGTSCSP